MTLTSAAAVAGAVPRHEVARGVEDDHLREVPLPARAGDRRFWRLSAPRAHTKAPYRTDVYRKTLMALNRPEAARTVGSPGYLALARAEGRCCHSRLPSCLIHIGIPRIRNRAGCSSLRA
jgi:hypothetical protein